MSVTGALAELEAGDGGGGGEEAAGSMGHSLTLRLMNLSLYDDERLSAEALPY